MIIIDAQLSPHLAKWIQDVLAIETYSAKYLGLRDASDKEIFDFAKVRNAIVMTKDEDFVKLQSKLGSPPKIIWITCGNTANERMRKILKDKLPEVIKLLKSNDLIEITD